MAGMAGDSVCSNASRISLILTCGCLGAGTKWDGLAGGRARTEAESLSWKEPHSHLWLLGGWDKMGRVGRGQGRKFTHSHLWLLGGWDKMGRVGRGQGRKFTHSHLWLLGGRDRMGRVGRGQGPLISRVTVVEMHSMVALESVKLRSFYSYSSVF
jgi:hypothetical protein